MASTVTEHRPLTLRRILSYAYRHSIGFRRDPDAFLKKVQGVIHVGANAGQEREQYAGLGLSVIWVEPIPEVFATLQANLVSFPRQRACQYLLTDRDGQTYEFKIASNGGASSSILDIALHKDIWPDIHYVGSMNLTSATLSTMIQKERVDIRHYQALVMDTQGTELMVLKGAGDLLKNFRYIKAEAADFEVYHGCCLVDDLTNYVARFGFRELRRTKLAKRKGGGTCFDVVYRRVSNIKSVASY
jgi:FkbM family methyltransferase